MSVFDDLKERFDSFGTSLEDFSENILDSSKYRKILRDYNIENLQAGIRPDGSEIQKEPKGNQKNTGYEEGTIRKKEKAGKVYDHVTLYDHSDFYKGLKVVKDSGTLQLVDIDDKTEILTTVWGEVIGITQEQREEFMSIIYEDYKKFVRENLYS